MSDAKKAKKKRPGAGEPRWQEIRELREALLSDTEDPGLIDFEQAWSVLGAALPGQYGGRNNEAHIHVPDRRDEYNIEPFEQMMDTIDAGYYPPPEMMLWLAGSWQEYIEARGTKTLEEVFLGVRGAGGYARRWNSIAESYRLYRECHRLVELEGLSPERAAEKLIDKYEIRRKNGDGPLIDPSSLLRRFREHIGYGLRGIRKKKLSEGT